MTLRKIAGLGALLSLALPGVALAAEEPVLNSGDTAWMLISTALVLLMTIPGLALFYGGMVRAKNVLSIMMQCFAITGLITILWVVYGYSLAFDTAGMEKGVLNFNSFVGGLDKAFLSGLTADGLTSATALFPESVFITFQMTFAIITPALIVGAFAERMKFSAMLIFMAVWFTVVYAPIAHMVWSGDGALMWDWGVLDFAGAPWCILTPVSPAWSPAWCWASARATRPRRWHRTTSATPWSGRPCCGSAGSVSTPVPPPPPTAPPGWPCW
ncbi:ammonium transporter AmtB [Pseudomonas aeruginosa]|nr:ammonium transporter AmtB [Pseudomonas aeruginosa]